MEEDLEINTWYWTRGPRDVDEFYPVYINNERTVIIDDKEYGLDEMEEGLTWHKAVMPK